MVLNSYTLPLKARHFLLLLKEVGSWVSVVTSEAFCRSEMRDREEQNTATRGFLYKTLSLMTFFPFVSLFSNTVTSITQGNSGPDDRKTTV